MSQRKGAANSKFGHLFGDTSDSSTGSSKSSRLSISGDLYKDPLAAFNPPITASTTTTRGGAAAVKATLSSPPASSSAAVAAAAGSKTPPGSGSNSRSSSRLQHHALFSSLTGDSGGSLFDSAPQSASLSLSAAKRDLLFGDSSGPTSSSSASRKTSTTISRNSSSSSRVPSPPLGVRVSTTALNPDASPLGESTINSSNKDEDAHSIKSPLSTQPLTRTNSQASTISHESVKSSRSVQSQDTVDDARSIASSTRSGIPSKAASVVSTSAAPPTSAPPLSSKISTSTRPAVVKRSSVDQPSKQSAPTASTIVDPIFNPLDQSQSQSTTSSEPQSPRLSKERIPHSASSTTSSQSIETFQSISRTSSPNFAPPPLSKNGFERDAENASPAPSSRSSRPEAMNLRIPDDAAEAFANDLLFTSGPNSPQISSMLGHRSSSFLDSGIASSRSLHQPSIADTLGNSNTFRATITTSNPGVGVGSTGHPRTGSGFSLGEDVVDSSNPWMNSLADSLQETKLMMVDGSASKVIDYTQSDDMGGPIFAQEAAFTLPSSTNPLSRSGISSSSSSHRNNTISSSSIGSHYPSSLLTPVPTLQEDIGGFDDVFSSTRSKSNSNSTAASMAPPTIALSTNWNIRDAVEAAALDPDFQGPRSIVNQSRDKVLAIMQMPKDPLEKDASDQEAFDNPWE